MPPGFWTELTLLLAITILLVGIIPAIFRYGMKADKKKWFSYNHINRLHKKIDWTLRILAIISMLVSAILFYREPFLIPLILAILGLSQISTQAYIEWRFSENRKNYQVSLIQLALTFIAYAGVFYWLRHFM
ncbi:DUF4181 domain-containing protein [Sporosarcina aquimarina]|nr:DUF4181 domain-containing protein [Sporosarcina aquimarina]